MSEQFPHCYGPRLRATQVGEGLCARVDTRRLGGRVKLGHDGFVFKVKRNA